MIDIIKRTPYEYSKQSRDYQVLARLYSALFNVSKLYIDNMDIWDRNIDNRLSVLRARTLNFDPQHDWDLDDLDVVTSCFKYLIKYKGTKQALQYIVSIMMKIRRIDDEIDESTVEIKDNLITIRLEDDLVTLGIMEDIIRYLLPAGYMYRIIEYRSYDLTDILSTEAGVSDKVRRVEHTGLSYKMYIGNNKGKRRRLTHTYVYNNSEMWVGPGQNDFIPDFNGDDPDIDIEKRQES